MNSTPEQNEPIEVLRGETWHPWVLDALCAGDVIRFVSGARAGELFQCVQDANVGPFHRPLVQVRQLNH